MTLADDLDAVWAEVAPILADSFHSDTYVISRMVMTSDGRGGERPSTTPPTYTTVETNKCELRAAKNQGMEYVSGQRVTGKADYYADLPLSTVLKDTDTLTVNGRDFSVLAVKRGGDWSTSVLVELEARS